MNKKGSLFHISKRDALPLPKALLIRGGILLLALVFCGLITTLLTGQDPIAVYGTILKGAFGTSRKIWVTGQNVAVLLGISLAVTPAFIDVLRLVRIEHIDQYNGRHAEQLERSLDGLVKGKRLEIGIIAECCGRFCIAAAQPGRGNACQIGQLIDRRSTENDLQTGGAVRRRRHTGRLFTGIYAMLICHGDFPPYIMLMGLLSSHPDS